MEFRDQKACFGNMACNDFLVKEFPRDKYSQILFVTGKESFYASGAEQFLHDAAGLEPMCRFSDFDVNPTFDDVQRGLKRFNETKPDCIMAVGGGSVLDMAKLINFFGASDEPSDKWFDDIPLDRPVSTLPLVAIPTTAGAGSEATSFAVLYRDKKKYSVAHSSMLPDIVLLNPALTGSMTPYQTACSGFDAFAQAMESYWAAASTETSRRYSAESIGLCKKHLECAVFEPSMAHRTGMMKAAYLAGRAINITKTTAAHALSYVLTAHCGLPHGHAVAMMFPWIFALNAEVSATDISDARGIAHVKHVMDELCGMLGGESAGKTVERMQGLCDRIGLDKSWIREPGINIEDVQELIVNGVNRERLRNNPRNINADDLRWVASHIR